ncbi:hypothetical protein ACFY1P_34775 [Streptomyces sp. NPDC001407]|uniref:hypothetical protein n=1 Tax=unclassified Streptomyces TaxID=2593676 RepID=UPI0033C5E426
MTANIDQLIASKDGLDPALLAALDDNDRADLLNRALAADDPNRMRAMSFLSLIDPSPDGVLAQAVGRAVTDGDPFVVAGALSLAACLGNSAVPLVQGAASNGEPLIALSAWATLEQIAKSDVLDALHQLAPSPGDVVGDQAAFALSVIAYRGGQTGFELTPPADSAIRAIEAGQQAVSAITSSAPTDDDFALLAKLTAGELYLISPEQRATVAIDCGEHLLLCIDPTVLDGLPNSVVQAPALAGLVADQNLDGTRYGVRYLVLTWPDGSSGVHVLLCDPSGAQAYYGHPAASDITDGTATFPLFAVDRPGAGSVAVTVTASASGVSLSGDLQVMDEIVTDRQDPTLDDDGGAVV